MMVVDIRLTPDLSAEQYQQLFHWKDDVFQVAHYALEWRPKTHHLCVYADEQLVGNVSLLTHTVRVDNTPVVVGGIGSVVTLPHAQGRGFGSLALEEAARMMHHTLHAEFGLLFCSEPLVSFYARQHWQRVQAPVVIEQPTGAIHSPLPVLVLPLQERAWPQGTVYLNSLPW